MRIILNDKLLSTKRFNQLTKEQIILLLKLSAKFGEDNDTTVTATKEYICAVYMCELEDLEVLLNLGFFSVESKQCTLREEYITFFKNNASNAAKSKEKKKSGVVVEPQSLEVKKEIVKREPVEDKTDWENVKANFNLLCEGRQISKVTGLDNNRQKAARSLYKVAKTLKDPVTGESFDFGSLEDFINQYLEEISSRNGFVKGWDFNGKPWKSNWDFFFKRATLFKIMENPSAYN